MKHLSLYILGGFGHIKPAVALTEQFTKMGIRSRSFDIFSKDGSPNYHSANLYNSISRSPILSPIWNIITRHNLLPAWIFEPAHMLEVLTNKDTIKNLREVVKDPDNTIITATHWTPALLAAKAFPQNTIFLYVTDIYVHGLWKIKPKNVHYLVPHEETKIVMTRHGIPPERITLAPFPIHHEILDHHQKRIRHRISVLQKKNLKRVDLLVMSGGAGTGRKEMEELLDHFAVPAKAEQLRLTFLVSTDTLEKQLIDYVDKNIKTHKEQIFITRYTPHSLYAAMQKAEILVTKAGGDITFEALAEGLPIYTLKDVGDHERLNRQYLEHLGASKPLFLTGHPWDMIQSDILTGEITLMTRASSGAGKFHRSAITPKIIKDIIAGKRA